MWNWICLAFNFTLLLFVFARRNMTRVRTAENSNYAESMYGRCLYVLYLLHHLKANSSTRWSPRATPLCSRSRGRCSPHYIFTVESGTGSGAAFTDSCVCSLNVVPYYSWSPASSGHVFPWSGAYKRNRSILKLEPLALASITSSATPASKQLSSGPVILRQVSC